METEKQLLATGDMALGDMVSDDPSHILTIESPDVAPALLALSRHHGLDVVALITRSQTDALRDEILDVLIVGLCQIGYSSVVRLALLDLPVDFYRASHACLVFTKPGDLSLLAKKVAADLAEDCYTIPLDFDTSAQWEALIRGFIQRPDFKRAWETIKKAHRGFVILSEPSTSGFASSAAGYWGAASPRLIETMVDNLFDAMCARGILSQIPRSEIGEPLSPSEKITRFQTHTPRDGRRPSSALVATPRPGWKFAMDLFLDHQAESSSGQPWEDRYVLKLAGLKALAIARYMSDQRKRGREARHAQALAEYWKSD